MEKSHLITCTGRGRRSKVKGPCSWKREREKRCNGEREQADKGRWELKRNISSGGFGVVKLYTNLVSQTRHGLGAPLHDA